MYDSMHLWIGECDLSSGAFIKAPYSCRTPAELPSKMLGEVSPLSVPGRLKQLRQMLSRLHNFIPDSGGSHYPFRDFQIDSDWVETTGSVEGSINHTLEIVFGSRAERVAAGLSPVLFKFSGSDLEAVVDVLSYYVEGDAVENAILLNWVDDLTRSAESIIKEREMVSKFALF